MKVIETVYNGYRFRSRLEARWAVFFEQCGITYRYEPEAYDLANVPCPAEYHGTAIECCCGATSLLGKKTGYLPDFFLVNVGLRSGAPGVFFEVKGLHDDSADAKAQLLGVITDRPVVVAEIPPTVYEDWTVDEGLYQLAPSWDNYMVFMRCQRCQTMKIEFWEGNYMVCPRCAAPARTNHPSLVKAAAAARSWRFEPRKDTP